MQKRYKNELAQKTFDNAIKCTYPMSFVKDGIGGSFSDAFNAGYEGKSGGVYRFVVGSAGHVFYNTGKQRKEIDSTIK